MIGEAVAVGLVGLSGVGATIGMGTLGVVGVFVEAMGNGAMAVAVGAMVVDVGDWLRVKGGLASDGVGTGAGTGAALSGDGDNRVVVGAAGTGRELSLRHSPQRQLLSSSQAVGK
jgi:hypothetical protein